MNYCFSNLQLPIKGFRQTLVHFIHKTTTRVKPDLSSLPPTITQSSFLGTVQEWLGNQLAPTDWDRRTRVIGQLQPLITLIPAALTTIFCNCTKGCGKLP